jgi:hypothetical protein
MRDIQHSPGLKKDAASLHASPHLTLVISPKKLALGLTLVVLSLILAHVAVQYIKFFQGHPTLFGFHHQLNLDDESNLPTWYSSSALLLSAILLAVIGLANKREGNPYTREWLGLAAIFLYLSLDEAAELHEGMGASLRPMLKAAGYFHGFLRYSWVIPGAMFVLIVALTYLRFLAALPVKTRALFLIAGSLYVGGALGIEMLGGRHEYLYGKENFSYLMFVAVEEGLEMLGIVVFLYALVSHLGSSRSGLQILIEDCPLEHTSHLVDENELPMNNPPKVPPLKSHNPP